MSGIETALLIASTGLGVVQSLSSAQAQSDAANFQARIAEQQAERERLLAAQEADDLRLRERRLLATNRARRGGLGILPQGTPLLVDQALASQIELAAQRTVNVGAARAFGFEQQAALRRHSADRARLDGYFSAGQTLLTGGMQLSRSFGTGTTATNPEAFTQGRAGPPTTFGAGRGGR